MRGWAAPVAARSASSPRQAAGFASAPRRRTGRSRHPNPPRRRARARSGPPRCVRPAHRKERAMRLSDVLAGRLRAVRLDLYGEHGGPLLAETLGIPTCNWVRYESGAPMPGQVLLRFIAVAGVEPQWLLTGEGRRYRDGS